MDTGVGARVSRNKRSGLLISAKPYGRARAEEESYDREIGEIISHWYLQFGSHQKEWRGVEVIC